MVNRLVTNCICKILLLYDDILCGTNTTEWRSWGHLSILSTPLMAFLFTFLILLKMPLLFPVSIFKSYIFLVTCSFHYIDSSSPLFLHLTLHIQVLSFWPLKYFLYEFFSFPFLPCSLFTTQVFLLEFWGSFFSIIS